MTEGEWQQVGRRRQSAKEPIWPARQPKRPPTEKELKKRHAEREVAVGAALEHKAEPARFEVLYVEVPNPRSLLRAKGRERDARVVGVLRALGIDKYVSGASVMPGGTIQLVCMLGAAAMVKEIVPTTNATLKVVANPFARPAHSHFDIEKDTKLTARRTALLCRLSRARNYHEAVLEGASPLMRTAVLTEYRGLVRNNKALLGHEGRWYSTTHSPPTGGHEDDETMGGQGE